MTRKTRCVLSWTLPADDNSLALGASVQNLVGRVPGAKLESFQTVSSNENSSDSNKNAARQATIMPIILEVFNR